MKKTEMKTVEVQIPKNAITARIVGVITVKGGLGLETYEINRDDLCNADWGDDDGND
ncbi:MAG: hypothetical protein IJ418_02060 [Clostridia bacterium]|nr:hypothetical protein [Clostridia bacterium]